MRLFTILTSSIIPNIFYFTNCISHYNSGPKSTLYPSKIFANSRIKSQLFQIIL